MTTTLERVQKGQALLNERLPGWREVMHPETLELDNCNACVLGQLFGDYHRGLAALGIPEEEAADYGFQVPEMQDRPSWYRWDSAGMFGLLTRIWRRALKA